MRLNTIENQTSRLQNEVAAARFLFDGKDVSQPDHIHNINDVVVDVDQSHFALPEHDFLRAHKDAQACG